MGVQQIGKPFVKIPKFLVLKGTGSIVVFFHAAAALIHHHQEINKFFSSGILPDDINLELQSVSLDVADERVLCLLCAVALFYVKVTGPYWWLINSLVKYCDFYLHVQRMHSCFQKWTEEICFW